MLSNDKWHVCIRKEWAMVVPLIFAILAVLVALSVIRALLPLIYSDAASAAMLPSIYQPLWVPTLFAIGLPFVLVTVERETGSLDWLRTLPASPRFWIYLKGLVALACLGGAWFLMILAHAGLGWFADIDGAKINWPYWGDMYRARQTQLPLSWTFWMLQSVFLLMLGFAAAWTFSTLRAVMIFMGTSLATIWVLGLLGHIGNHFSFAPVVASCQWIMIPVSILMVDHFGRRSLRPDAANGNSAAGLRTRRGTQPGAQRGTRAANDSDMDSGAIASHRNKRGQSQAFGLSPPPSTVPTGVLIWQSWTEGRMTWLGLTLMMLFGIGSLVFLNYFASEGYSDLGVVFLLAPLAVCWMGVSVWRGDGSVPSLRFVSDRGYAAAGVFWARHAVPLAILAFTVVLYAIVYAAMVSIDSKAALPSWLAIVLAGSYLYLTSSWLSQWMGRSVLAYLIVPVLVVLLATWLIYGLTYSAHQIAWCVLVFVVMGGASYLATRQQMQTDERRRTWVINTAALVVICLIPLMVLLPTLWPANNLHEELWLAARIRYANQHPPTAGVQRISWQDGYSRSATGQLRADFNDWITAPTLDGSRSLIADLEKQTQPWTRRLVGFEATINANDDDFVCIYLSDRRTLVRQLSLQKLAYKSQPSDIDAIAQWRSDVQWVSNVSVGLRRSHDLGSLTTADLLEIWLLDVLQDDTLREALSPQQVKDIIARLPTIAQRNRARTLAIVKPRNSPEADSTGEWQRPDQTRSHLLAAASDDPPNDWRSRLFASSTSQSISSPIFDDSLEQIPAEVLRVHWHEVGFVWNLSWEQQIERIKETLP